MRAKVNVADRLAAVGDYFSPKIVGYLNELKKSSRFVVSSSGTRIRIRTTSSSSCAVD